MANITITVQSLLNTAVYDSYTIDNGQTVNQLKTAINSAQGFDSTWYDIVLNESVVSGTATLSSLGIVSGTQLRTHNKISRLATRELRQKSKLDLDYRQQELESVVDIGNIRKKMDLELQKSKTDHEEEILKLNHYTNLRPMWHVDNIRKSNKILEK